MEYVAGDKFEEGRYWTAMVGKVDDKEVTFKLKPHAQCWVAKWKIEIAGKLAQGGAATSYVQQEPIYLICNPWCDSKAPSMSVV